MKVLPVPCPKRALRAAMRSKVPVADGSGTRLLPLTLACQAQEFSLGRQLLMSLPAAACIHHHLKLSSLIVLPLKLRLTGSIHQISRASEGLLPPQSLTRSRLRQETVSKKQASQSPIIVRHQTAGSFILARPAMILG